MAILCSKMSRTSIAILLLFCFLNLLHFSRSSKYSKKANEEEGMSDEEFRALETPFKMKKVNLVWIHGKKRLSGGKLAALYEDLKIQDKHEAHLKKLKADGLDSSGQMESKVHTNYKRIVEYFDLESELGGVDFINNELPSEDEEKEVSFQDPKLQSMWRRAQNAGFSVEDMTMLKGEFEQQQLKVHEFDYTHRDLNNVVDLKLDNSLEWEEKKLGLSAAEVKERKAVMKKDMKDLTAGYMRLEQLMVDLPRMNPVFNNDKMDRLWMLARQTNWTKEELFKFQEELKDLEHRLSKQTFYQEQIAKEKENDIERNQDVLQSLEEKHKQISHKITKIHKEIKSRLGTALQHSEL